MRRTALQFTLVELLVVVGIIAILAGILLPVVYTAKEQGQRSLCLNSVRTLVVAATQYADNNDEYLAPPGWGSADGTDEQCWLYQAPLDPANEAQQLAQMQRGLLWPFIADVRLCKCPTDIVQARALPTLYQQRIQKISSYIMNGAVAGYGRLGVGRSFRNRQFPGTALLFWETDERTPFYFNDASSFPFEGVTVRHRGGAMVGAFDGRAWRILDPEFYAEVARHGTPNFLWCAPDTMDGH